MTDRGAILSDCGRYRYRLHRRVTASDRIALFIMLNPSTADAEQDDPTIRRCMGFARAMDCGVLVVVNLFAYRSKSPKILTAAPEPVGPENDEHINAAAHGKHQGRDATIVGRLLLSGFDPVSLGETRDGSPRHPLYLSGSCKPLPYRGRS